MSWGNEDSIENICKTRQVEIIQIKSHVQGKSKRRNRYNVGRNDSEPVKESEWRYPIVIQDKKT